MEFLVKKISISLDTEVFEQAKHAAEAMAVMAAVLPPPHGAGQNSVD